MMAISIAVLLTAFLAAGVALKKVNSAFEEIFG